MVLESAVAFHKLKQVDVADPISLLEQIDKWKKLKLNISPCKFGRQFSAEEVGVGAGDKDGVSAIIADISPA